MWERRKQRPVSAPLGKGTRRRSGIVPRIRRASQGTAVGVVKSEQGEPLRGVSVAGELTSDDDVLVPE